jgi:DNA helicase-2/ATP-dependent DNA helicase PcrA
MYLIYIKRNHLLTLMNFDIDQQQVVSHIDGPMLVVAGAGSGKTATIIGRAAMMMQKAGILGCKHLMLTFSKKAADEMRHRLEKSVEPYLMDGMVIGTFHSFGYRLIREMPFLCGRKPNMTILDEKDVYRLLKEIAQTCSFEADDENGKALLKKMYGVYSFACNELLLVSESRHANQIGALLDSNGIYKNSQVSLFFELFKKYEEKKIEANVLDFDDLLTLPVIGLKSANGGREWGDSIAQRYEYLTVDEGQDTNRAQFELMRLIGTHKNIVLVGDDDQSIYSWRGASPSNMTDFKRQLNAKLVYLERNYRSTDAIIRQASQHVANNRNRFPKKAYAVRQGGNPIRLEARFSSHQARRELVGSIAEHIEQGGQPKDIAVLFRVNRIARLIEYELIEMGIPYKIVGGMNFEQRKEIRYALAIARLVINENDESALGTICELTEGIGSGTVRKIVSAANESGGGLLSLTSKVPARAKTAISLIAGTISFLRDIGGPNAMVDQILAREGLNVMSQFEKKDKAETVLGRHRNLIMLKELIAKWTMGCEKGHEWEVIFEKIVGSSSSTDENAENVVTLSSIHRSKGLEWSVVHVFGYSEGIMPLENRGSSKDSGPVEDADEDGDEGISDDEEERRLSYVAITRAKKECWLWHCDNYEYGYESKSHGMSRFAREIVKQV